MNHTRIPTLKIPRTSSEDVQDRLRELYRMLHEPCSIGELAARTGRSKKSVYKDLGKLAYQGTRLCSDRGMYWVDAAIKAPRPS